MKVRCLAMGVCDSHTPHGQLPGDHLQVWKPARGQPDATVYSLPVVLVAQGPVVSTQGVERLPPNPGCCYQGAPRSDCGGLRVCEIHDSPGGSEIGSCALYPDGSDETKSAGHQC